MINAPAARDLTPGTRVRVIGSKGQTGTFVRYFAPLPSGKRHVEVDWDDRSLYSHPLEVQIEAIASDNA
ncbi:hypothetical protein SEA_STEVIERAY_56 [Mycobacterium phage StevieRay]|uniref:Uncharacterized protein n=1 Tax=Mycobacterium phage StevieRay TaxID=2015811 RepID=A0A222ZKD5_9CAUD|nr:hypothetical protein SEA_STEVIERAY_56 [Mycobacterium phage StevieRay]